MRKAKVRRYLSREQAAQELSAELFFVLNRRPTAVGVSALVLVGKAGHVAPHQIGQQLRGLLYGIH